MLHLNDHLYSKSCVFLWVANFRGLTAGFTNLSTLSWVFTVGHICITKNTGAFTRGVSIPTCYYPTHNFIFIYTMLSCWTLSHRTESTQSNTKCSVYYNHALMPIQCDVPVHMQCNAPLHVISCHMHNECYMDNAKTVHFTMYHGQLY